jgi:hypothetical protein
MLADPRLRTARAVLDSLSCQARPALPQPSAAVAAAAAPSAAAAAAPSAAAAAAAAAADIYALRLSAYTQAGRCARMTTPFAPAAAVLHLHAVRARGESVALLGALGSVAGAPAAGAHARAPAPATAPDSLALRDGVAGSPGAVDAAAEHHQRLLHPLGLLGWRSGGCGGGGGGGLAPPAPLAPLVRADCEAAGARAAAAEAAAPAFAWPSGAQHAIDALRLPVLAPPAALPPARAAFTRETLALLGSLHAWRCEGQVLEQRRRATSAGVPGLAAAA